MEFPYKKPEFNLYYARHSDPENHIPPHINYRVSSKYQFEIKNLSIVPLIKTGKLKILLAVPYRILLRAIRREIFRISQKSTVMVPKFQKSPFGKHNNFNMKRVPFLEISKAEDISYYNYINSVRQHCRRKTSREKYRRKFSLATAYTQRKSKIDYYFPK